PRHRRRLPRPASAATPSAPPASRLIFKKAARSRRSKRSPAMSRQRRPNSTPAPATGSTPMKSSGSGFETGPLRPPKTTKLSDRTSDRITLDEVDQIAVQALRNEAYHEPGWHEMAGTAEVCNRLRRRH